MTQPTELYSQVGQGIIRLDNIREIVLPKQRWWSLPFLGKKDDVSTAKPLQEKKENEETKEASGEKKEAGAEEKPKKKVPHSVVLTDEDLNKKFVLSNCCHPIPGDDVLGYMDAKNIMHIHKIDCPEANLLKTSYGKRIYSATWNTHRLQSFVETIELKGIDKFGVFIQVLQTITKDFHINMRSINVSSEDGIFRGSLEVYVYDRKELDELLKAIRKIDDVKEVKRAGSVSE